MKSRLKMSFNNSGQSHAAAAAHVAQQQAAHQQQQASQAAAAQAQQQYCLKWNQHTNNMMKVFNELLGDENFVDVTLACDGESIKAHKLVLSACSSWFRDLLINNPCEHPIVIMGDIRYEDLRAIIDFMYSGEVNVSYNQLWPLLKAAVALKVKGLMDVDEKHGGIFFGGNNNGGSNGGGPKVEINGGGSDAGSLYRGMDLDNSARHGGSPFGGGPPSPGSPVPGADPSSQYLSFMTQRFRKRKRKHHMKNGGSALALANMLGQNGSLSSVMAAAAAAAAANQQSNGVNGNSSAMPKNGGAGALIVPGANGLSAAVAKKLLANHNSANLTDPDDNNESGDEVNSAKRTKDSHSSNDDSTVNQDDPKSPNSSYHNSSNNSHHHNTHLDENEMMAMALSMARNQNGAGGVGTGDDDDEDRHDDGSMNGDGETDSQMHHDGSMMMGDSDDEFYTDVKPIVSLDESPSPTNSNMDDSAYSNSFVPPGILENSLSGLSPGSQLPNSSTKMCVCHLCHLTFTAYSSLRRHMTRHYADRERYECDICLKSYSRKDYLKEHKKLKHSDVAKVMSSQKAKANAAAVAAAAAAAAQAAAAAGTL